MSRMLSKMNLISVAQQLPKEDIETIQGYVEMIEEENQEYKEVIDKIMNLIKQYGKYDGKKCTRGFQMWSADFNKILDILKEVSE